MKNIIILLILISSPCFAKSSIPPYQVDLIIFTHHNSSHPQADLFLKTKHTLPLKDYSANANSLYQRLSSKASQLQREYYALNRNTQYKVFAHYSWLQPANNNHTILLPLANRDNLQMQGTIRIRQSNYYLLDTHLLFTSMDKNSTQFAFNKIERLKADTLYYFDHPTVGLIIKIHKTA